jgi:hypothetical protein
MDNAAEAKKRTARNRGSGNTKRSPATAALAKVPEAGR